MAFLCRSVGFQTVEVAKWFAASQLLIPVFHTAFTIGVDVTSLRKETRLFFVKDKQSRRKAVG
jgi:hypothetical protein